MKRSVAALIAAATLSGCAIDPDVSYVGPLSAPNDANVLAFEITEFTVMRLPAAQTVLVLDPTPDDQASNTLTPLLTDDLHRRGFAIADTSGATSTSHHLRYVVTPLDGGDLMRVTLDGGSVEASRYFVRNTAGTLQAGGPFAIRTQEASR